MYDKEDLLLPIYVIIGIMIILIMIDYFILNPIQKNKQTNILIKKLETKNKQFYKDYRMIKMIAQKGIVIVINNDTFEQGYLLIKTLRYKSCKLPIIVYYENLTEENIVNIRKYNVNTIIVEDNVKGCQARIYALVFAPFNEVLLLDSSFLFFNNPEYLFNDPLYTKTGALFWKDCKTPSNFMDSKIYNWIKNLIPFRKDDNRILDKQSASYQSKDILVFNKNNHIKTLEKLYTIFTEWSSVYNNIHSDKECYWIASELANEPYIFVDKYPGIIGDYFGNQLYGNSLYLDSSNNLLGWNGSLFYNDKMIDYKYYSFKEPEKTTFNMSNDVIHNSADMLLTKSQLNLINNYFKTFTDK